MSFIARRDDLPTRQTQDQAQTWSAVLLDRQPLWLAALSSVLARHGIDTVATASTPAAGMTAVRRLAPTVLVLDPWLEDESGNSLEAVAGLRAELPALRIVCLGSVEEDARIDEVFAAGADAYVVRVAEPDEVGNAVRCVCSEHMHFAAPSAPRHPVPERPVDAGPAVALTRRELEILRIVAEGKANGEIARLLWVTEQTVKFHLSNVYRKLGVANRTEAGRWAHLHNLLPLEEQREEGLDRALLRVVGS